MAFSGEGNVSFLPAHKEQRTAELDSFITQTRTHSVVVVFLQSIERLGPAIPKMLRALATRYFLRGSGGISWRKANNPQGDMITIFFLFSYWWYHDGPSCCVLFCVTAFLG